MLNKESSFIGSVPEFYERYLVPMHFEAHARIMGARLGALRCGHLLEIAAGTGAVTRLLARELPDTVEITATDLNEPMLEIARLQPGTDRVRWQQEDATSLSFKDSSFDLVLCQFGVMFFPRKVGAFRETFRALKPGGRFIFSVWDRTDRNPLMEIIQRALSSLFPEEVLRSNLLPFSYYQPEAIRADLAAAGFIQSELEVVIGRTQAPSARAVAIAAVQSNFLRPKIEAYGPGWLERATETVSKAITTSIGDRRTACATERATDTRRRGVFVRLSAGDAQCRLVHDDERGNGRRGLAATAFAMAMARPHRLAGELELDSTAQAASGRRHLSPP